MGWLENFKIAIHGHTYTELIERSGVDYNTAKKWPYGSEPRVCNAIKIAAALGKSVEEVFDSSGELRDQQRRAADAVEQELKKSLAAARDQKRQAASESGGSKRRARKNK